MGKFCLMRMPELWKCNSLLRTKSQAVLVVFDERVDERVTSIGFTSLKQRFSAKIPVTNKLI